MILPIKFDMTPSGDIVERANFGESGYAENTEYSLKIEFNYGEVDISYYGEDGSIIDCEDDIVEIIESLGLETR